MADTVLNLGSRRELFVDEFLMATRRDVQLKLHRPERREVALTFDAPWEDNVAFPDRILHWGDGWRLYYRAAIQNLKDEENSYVMAVAESRDGITFTRPELGLVEFQGSRRNNILQIRGFPHVPPPFVDTNPAGRPDQRFKGLTGCAAKAVALASADGLRWAPMHEGALALPGQFDTVNTGFWDSVAGCYRCYSRSWHDRESRRVMKDWDFKGAKPVRAIQHASSPDFIHWAPPQQLEYADGDYETQLYTNAILPCPGAEHVYLGFPNRFMATRKPTTPRPHDGINDALFMSSRDGVRWDRWRDAWVRPGPDPLNWTDRNNYPSWGIAETSPTEWTMYITEHYRHDHVPTRLRRLAVRPWGFVSAHADLGGGELVTRPFTFAGATLRLNAATSAAGSVQVEVQDKQGHALPDFALADMAPWYGDSVDAPMAWRGGGDLAALAGQPIRLRFVLSDADVYALRFA